MSSRSSPRRRRRGLRSSAFSTTRMCARASTTASSNCAARHERGARLRRRYLDSPTDFVLTNAKIVAADRIFDGWVAIADGRIAEIGEGPARGLDMAGDYVIPGLVELHTDHLEAHLLPRPKVRWDMTSAILAYDAQMAASGVTT